MGVFKWLLVALVAITGCTPDYSVVGRDEVYVTVYEEVPGEPTGDIWVDSFNQPGTTDGVDILWILDSSCSMTDDQDRLIAGIGEMMNNLPEANWRLNMVTSSPILAETEELFPLVPGDTADDAREMYDDISKNEQERGMDTALSYILENPYAETWMRWNSALLLVFVSDEEDQSDANLGDFIYWLEGLRPAVYVSSIVNLAPKESLCNTNDLDTGLLYHEVTNAFDGVVIDICQKDWTSGVRDASIQIDPISEWELTHLPIQGSIVVFVDGQPYYKWFYNPTLNKIKFDVLPDGGSLVEIGYRYL